MDRTFDRRNSFFATHTSMACLKVTRLERFVKLEREHPELNFGHSALLWLLTILGTKTELKFINGRDSFCLSELKSMKLSILTGVGGRAEFKRGNLFQGGFVIITL
jgi:hypothetical protein